MSVTSSIITFTRESAITRSVRRREVLGEGTSVKRTRRRPGAAAASMIIVLTLTSASSLLRTAAAEIVAKAARFVLPNCGCCSAFVPSNLQPAISRSSIVRSRADPVGRCTRSLRALDNIRRRRRRCRLLLPVDASPPASISSRGRRRRVSGIAEARAAVQQPGYRTSTRRVRRTRLFCSSVGKDSNNKQVTGIAPAPGTAAAAIAPTPTAKDEASARARSTRDVDVSSWKLELGGMALEVRGGGSRWSHAAAVAGDELPPTARVDVAGSSVAVRLRRNQAESKRLRTSGSRDISFEFSDMHEAIPLPCRIQLVPRADRRSLVYVDGKELPRRRTGANAAGDGGSLVMADSSGAIPPSSFEITPEISRGVRVASVGLAAIAATASGAGTTRPVTGSTEGGLHENKGFVYPENGNTYFTDDRDQERVLAEGQPSRPFEAFAGDALKLVGEMEISKPAYLQVQEGGYDRSDALLVTQFGLTRSGALLRIDLDSPPLPTSPPLLPPPPMLLGNAGSEERAITAAAAAAAAAAVGDELPRSRARLRLTGTWGDPLVWPNEVNEVPSSAVVRLTRGEEAEACFLAYRRSEHDDGCGGQEIMRGRGSLDSIGRQYRARFPHLGRDEFNRLRAESDNFVNRVDGSNPQLGQTAQRNPDPFPRGTEEGSPAGASKHTHREEDVPDRGERAEEPCSPPEWNEPLPPRAVLVADGFLVPGKADGGVYIIIPSLLEKEEGGGGFDGDASGAKQDQRCAEGRMVQLTRSKRGWFYHKAVWVELPGRERKVVLTARARKPLFGPAEGELVLLEMPRVNAPLADQNLPWRETVLAKGPDVMFEVVDLDPTDCTVQVMCAEFFGGRVTMHSLWGGDAKPGSRPSVTESWVLDEDAGPAYSITAADLRGGSPTGRPTHFLVTTHESSYRGSSPGAVAAAWMRENSGLSFEPDRVDADQTEADLLRVGAGARVGGAVGASSTCEEGLFACSETGESEEKREEEVRWWDVEDAGRDAGGKLLAYEIPEHWRIVPNRPPGPGCCGWRRETLASGFRVRGISINAGSPGFPYIFHPHKSMEGKRPPYIALAGDCSQAAYILRPAPVPVGSDSGSGSTSAGAEKGSIDSERTLSGGHGAVGAPLVYEVACKIEVPGTVGSLAVGYGSFMDNGRNVVKPSVAAPPSRDGSIGDKPSVSQERVVEGGNIDGAAGGWAKLFVPNYDGNKVYVFSMEPHA